MTNSFLTDPNQFQQAQRIARAFSESELVPQHMRGKMADCLVALHIANQMDEDPLQVMQSLYQVGGRPGWITAFMISRANKSGRFMDPIDWEIEGAGKTAKVTAFVQLRRADGTAGRTVRSPMVDMTMAQAEGWTRNKKYETMPELMFRYRAATLLIRLYAPEVLYGYHTVEEIEDISPLKDVTPPKLGIDDFKPGAGRKPSVTIEAEPEPAQADGPPEAEREGSNARSTAPQQAPPPADPPKARLDLGRRMMTRCQADDDGDCDWNECPQRRDGEPQLSGRHCPFDNADPPPGGGRDNRHDRP
jgi:hypothetical protein